MSINSNCGRTKFAAFFTCLLFLVGASGCGSKIETNGTNALRVRNYSAGEKIKVPTLNGPIIAANESGNEMEFLTGGGKVSVLNVWASWCPPCRKEGPDYGSVSIANKNVRFLGIDTRDNAPDAEAYMRTNGIKYPSITDPDGSVVLKLAKIVPVSAIPSTIIVDKNGLVATTITGPADRTTLQEAINDAQKR